MAGPGGALNRLMDGLRRLGRRAFLGSAGMLLLPSGRSVRGYPAHGRLRLAVVGMAGYGAWHGFAEAIHAYPDVEYAVSCDVDRLKAARVYDLWEKRAAEWPRAEKEDQRKAAEVYARLASRRPPLYADFRRMFDEAAGGFDAVVVATPDHTHTVVAAAALRAGKPVLAEKPLSISAHEARALRALVRERRLATQVNTGGAAAPAFRRGVEILREGLLGEVRDVHVFFSRGGRNFQKPPQGTLPVPETFDWNLWLAQLRWRDYHPEWINRVGWRETGLGELGNFGPHSANMAFLGLGVRELWDAAPGEARLRVTAECSEINTLSFPRWERIRWEVPARGGRPPVTFTWHHGPPPDYAPGSRKMLEDLLAGAGAPGKFLPYAGCLIVGSKGLLATNSHNTEVDLFPRDRFEGVETKRPSTLPLSPGHYREWIEACRGGPPPLSNFDFAAPFVEFLAVGSLSTRFPGETLEFDPATGRIPNHPRAEEFLRYEYRKGWTL